MHYDSDETVDMRRITAILYLNQGWMPEHGALCPMISGMLSAHSSCKLFRYVQASQRQIHAGGELVLYPWPQPPVVLAPLHNRLVIFSSCRMLHRCCPCCPHRMSWCAQDAHATCA